MVDRVLRSALCLAVLVNLFGVFLFLGAATGHPSGLLPLIPQPFYAMQLALVIAIFAGVYGWLAAQKLIDRPMLMVGTLGKLGFFGLFVLHALAGDFPLTKAMNALPDLLLGLVFVWKLRFPTLPVEQRGRFPEGPANRFIVRPLDAPRSRGRRSEDLG